jgi:PAS domain S-box-containing protein
VHELQEHQVELEMQNEELRQERAKAEDLLSEELQQARARMGALTSQYIDLYEFAPAGYLTLDREGKIGDLNLAGARLLGVERFLLLTRRFGRFVAEGDRRAFSDFLERVFASQAKEHCEVVLPREGHDPLSVRIEGMRSADGQQCRTVVLDITEHKQMEKRMQIFSQEIIAAREEERKHVSSVLHHDAGSLAVGMSAHLDAIEKDLRSGKPAEALRWMKRTRKFFDKSVARLKGLAVELRPPELDILGLCVALRQYFSPVPQHGGTLIHFKENLGRRRLSRDSATMLFRVAQEALTNALKHGCAKRVDVDLRASKNRLTLTVHDDGNGFDPSEKMARATSQMGLRVMREMAASAGGVFTVDSQCGKGTTVRVSLPLSCTP